MLANKIGKKAMVGKAIDLIFLVFVSLGGFFLVSMFFSTTADVGNEELLVTVYNWQTSDEAIGILHAPIEINEEMSVLTYTLLASGSVASNYETKINELFDEVYGVGSWSIQIYKEGDTLTYFNGHIWQTLSSLASTESYVTREETISLESLTGEEIEIKIRSLGSGI